ncbi:MAG: D-amino acid aminotransferase [Bacillota bacterium]
MKNLAWIDGSYCNLDGARISIEDRGYLLGDGVYEVIRVYNGKPFYLDAHLERLKRSAGAVKIELPYKLSEIGSIVLDLVARSSCGEGYIYMQLTRGKAKRDHLFPPDTLPTLVMYVRDLEPIKAVEEINPIETMTLPDERWLNCYIKSTNLLPNLLARQKAAESGAMEALLYRQDKKVTEGTRSNIFAVIDGEVRTHPANNLILPGITRDIVLALLKDLSIPYSEKAINLNELDRAEEAWATSTTMEINPVAAIDGVSLASAPGPVCRRLMNAFRDIILNNS